MNGSAALRRALERCISARLTFAAFRRPGAMVEIWAQRDPALDHVEGDLLWEANQVFVVAPFNLEQARVPVIRSDVELEFGLLDPDVEALFQCVGSEPVVDEPVTPTGETSYKQAVLAAKTAIATDALEKVVLSKVDVLPFKQEDLPALFMALVMEPWSAMIALVHTPEHGFWFGASPERLVIEEEDHVRMDALAGTLPTGSAPKDANRWGAKESHEHGLVKQAIVDACATTGLVPTVGATTTVASGELTHLRTVIATDLNDRPLSDLVLALHPTPAVCGTPREVANAFIRAHETHDRSLYAGFWGPWCPDGRTELFVNIRCMHATGGQAVVFAGAGITAGSHPDQEWRETDAKAAVLLNAIALLRK